MAGTSPIKLGSASVSGWTFQTGSNSTTDQYGIQSCDVMALFPDGSNVYNNIPAEGSSFSTVFGNSYLPSSFLLDFFEGAPRVDFLEGTVAKTIFRFKRIDPLFANRRTISVDTVLNYDSQFNQSSFQVVGLGGTAGLSLTGPNPNTFGFPEPTVSVKYSTSTPPGIGAGDLSTLYALPGSIKAQGFPTPSDVTIPTTFLAPAGALVGYFDGSTYQSLQVNVDTTFTFSTRYKSHPRGWQLTKLQYTPVANRNFFAVEETWRNYYFFFGVQFVSKVPP